MILCLILSFGYPCWVPTNESYLFNCAPNFPDSDWLFGLCKQHSDWLHFTHFPEYQNKDYFNLQTNKREDKKLIFDLDIHSSKVFNSVHTLHKHPQSNLSIITSSTCIAPNTSLPNTSLNHELDNMNLQL